MSETTLEKYRKAYDAWVWSLRDKLPQHVQDELKAEALRLKKLSEEEEDANQRR